VVWQRVFTVKQDRFLLSGHEEKIAAGPVSFRCLS
jgi:hypothetical protein